jgi:hypothetical protein
MTARSAGAALDRPSGIRRNVRGASLFLAGAEPISCSSPSTRPCRRATPALGRLALSFATRARGEVALTSHGGRDRWSRGSNPPVRCSAFPTTSRQERARGHRPPVAVTGAISWARTGAVAIGRVLRLRRATTIQCARGIRGLSPRLGGPSDISCQVCGSWVSVLTPVSRGRSRGLVAICTFSGRALGSAPRSGRHSRPTGQFVQFSPSAIRRGTKLDEGLTSCTNLRRALPFREPRS